MNKLLEFEENSTREIQEAVLVDLSRVKVVKLWCFCKIQTPLHSNLTGQISVETIPDSQT